MSLVRLVSLGAPRKEGAEDLGRCSPHLFVLRNDDKKCGELFLTNTPESIIAVGIKVEYTLGRLSLLKNV